MERKYSIDYQTLYNLYVNQNISTENIGKLYNVSKTTISRKLQEYDIKIRSRGSHLIDLTGQKFGKLTVVRNSGLKTKDGSIIWECICDCGKETLQSQHCLCRNKRSVTSCGCTRTESIRKSISKPKGEASFNRILYGYKRGAKDRNLEFNLTTDQFKNLIDGDCFYCGQKPKLSAITNRGYQRVNGNYVYNGIDRVDSSRGYTVENCVSCCTKCNKMKMALSEQEFLDHIERIYKHRIGA